MNNHRYIRTEQLAPVPALPAQLRSRIQIWPVLEALGLLALCMLLLGFVQFGTPGLADNDGYYHMRIGQVIREQGLTPAFPWLPMTILSPDAYYDHHLLYHLYLAFFTGNGSASTLILGAKLASILMPALAFLAIWWLLRGQRVRWAALWTIGLLAISQAFLYRMSMPRAQAASLLVLALGLHWLLQRRYVLLLPLGFVYVWLYDAFPLLLVLAGVSVGATLLTERRLEWRALAYPAAGMLLGLVINPYFPQNIAFIVHHLVPKFGQPTTSVGNEWYPYETWTLVENSGGALALWVLGALALGWRERRMDRQTLAAFALSVLFGLMLFKSRRFVEYFPPFALIFAALSSAPLFRPHPPAASPTRGEAEKSAPLSPGVGEGAGGWGGWWRHLALIVPIIVLLVGLFITLGQARSSMAGSKPATTYAAASGWLREHSPPGSMVFQTDWDDFPRLFFYNTANRYTIGLDPTYMERADPTLYATWVGITRGEQEQPGRIIREQFDAAYVLSDHKHTAFLKRAGQDPHLREVYRDDDAIIFEVIP